jgi:hypothetical protein
VAVVAQAVVMVVTHRMVQAVLEHQAKETVVVAH